MVVVGVEVEVVVVLTQKETMTYKQLIKHKYYGKRFCKKVNNLFYFL